MREPGTGVRETRIGAALPYDGAVTNYFPAAEPEWRTLSPQLVKAKLAARAITFPILTAIATIPTWIFAGWTWGLVVAVGLIAFFTWRISKVRPWCAAYRFARREHDLLVTEGLLQRELVSIPYGRIQTVSVNDGPFDRRWGMANVSVNTASDKDVTIPGLPTDEAAALRDELIALSETHAIAL